MMNKFIEKIKSSELLFEEWSKYVEVHLYDNTFSLLEDFLMNNSIQNTTWEFIHKHGTKEGRDEMLLYCIEILIEKCNETHGS